MHGWWFIWGDVVRDFMSLNKVEILPWDGGWGFLTNDLTDPLPDEHTMILYDRIAKISATPEASFQQLMSMYSHEPRLHLPEE
jgi:hypothetical protein